MHNFRVRSLLKLFNSSSPSTYFNQSTRQLRSMAGVDNRWKKLEREKNTKLMKRLKNIADCMYENKVALFDLHENRDEINLLNDNWRDSSTLSSRNKKFIEEILKKMNDCVLAYKNTVSEDLALNETNSTSSWFSSFSKFSGKTITVKFEETKYDPEIEEFIHFLKNPAYYAKDGKLIYNLQDIAIYMYVNRIALLDLHKNQDKINLLNDNWKDSSTLSSQSKEFIEEILKNINDAVLEYKNILQENPVSDETDKTSSEDSDSDLSSDGSSSDSDVNSSEDSDLDLSCDGSSSDSDVNSSEDSDLDLSCDGSSSDSDVNFSEDSDLDWSSESDDDYSSSDTEGEDGTISERDEKITKEMSQDDFDYKMMLLYGI